MVHGEVCGRPGRGYNSQCSLSPGNEGRMSKMILGTYAEPKPWGRVPWKPEGKLCNLYSQCCGVWDGDETGRWSVGGHV